MSSFAALEEKKPKKEKKEKKEKKSKKEKTDKERKAKKKKKKKDLLDKLASLPDADPNAISSGEECVQPDKTKAVTRSVIEAEYIPEEEVQSEEDVPVETEKERKKRIKKEKKEARRAAAAAAAAADSNNDGDEEEKSGETKSSGGSSETTKNKKEKKLTRKQKKQLELERSMKEMDKQIAVSSKFPFTISHCVQAIADKEAWKRSTDINIEEFTVAGTGAKGTQLFENAQLKIVAGRKYGLIGPNGMGKTTLLRLIHMKRLQIPPSIDFLMVEQEIEGSETRAIEAVLAADTKRASLMKKEQALLEELDARADVDDDDMDDESIAYGEKLLVDLEKVASELESIDASSAEPRARSILSGLGFTVEMQERATQKFSGGWRMRISLARALFINPTMLMLDEPTNHLDLNAVLWLDHYLRTWKGTLIVVSHDQDFLNNVVTDIIHLQERKLLYYKGNYEHFKLVSKQAFMDRVKAYEKQQKKLRQLKKNNTSGKKGDAKNQVVKKQREKGARSAKKAAKNAAASGGTSSESKNEELLTRPKEYTVNIVFPEPTELSPPIINVKDVSFRYGEGLPTLFTGVDFGLDMQSRVSMVGPNGVGKSTLLSLILGDLNPTSGDVRRNHRLRIGKYNQHFVDVLPMDKTPVSYLQSKNEDMPYQKIRNHLGKYGLKGHAHEILLKQCSGGQKARVVLASLALEAPHILVLDEPTNHLDIETIDALAQGLREFEGGVVLVSHDARLICEAGCELWVVDNKTVTRFEGEFDEYRDSLLEQIELDAEKEKAALEMKLAKRAQERKEKLMKAKERSERAKLNKNKK